MPAGIQVFSSAGTVQIDENYRNMAVREKGTQATPPTVPGAGLLAYQRSDMAGTNYTWWRYDAPQPSGAHYGLQVFNAAGNVIFDATLQYARVVDMFMGPASGTLTKTYAAGRAYAVITGKRGVLVEQQVRADPDSGHPFYNYRRRFIQSRTYVSGNQVIAGWYTPAWADNWSGPLMVIPDPAADDTAAQYIVLDVTGY